jgi:trans-2,3-dihydro-3-hydroxyanthranilate isomerase
MPQYRFYQLDVFTKTAFGGNPLAVFPDASGLTDDQMLRIAREMNLSETTFVLPPDQLGADFKVRIFTPEKELPFAGHPVIGTHWLLAHLGRVDLHEPATTVTFQLKVGLRAARLSVQNGSVTRVLMDHQTPQFYGTANRDQIERLARSLGITPDAILETGYPVQVVSTGIRQLFIPVRSCAEIDAMQPAKQDAATMNAICEEIDPVDHCHYSMMVLSLETLDPKAQVHTRMFAPGLRVPEDPATGSASGGLGAYLIEHKLIPATPPVTYIRAEQGNAMGRPSDLSIEVEGEPGALGMIRVGGDVVPLIEGVLTW